VSLFGGAGGLMRIEPRFTQNYAGATDGVDPIRRSMVFLSRDGGCKLSHVTFKYLPSRSLEQKVTSDRKMKTLLGNTVENLAIW
jgi:hypothetical protein